MKNIICALIISLTAIFAPQLKIYYAYNKAEFSTQQTEWSEVNSLIEDIKEDYNINIHIGETPKEYFGFTITTDCEYEYNYSKESLIKVLNDYHRALGKYNDYALSLIPQNVFMYSKIVWEGNKYVDGQVVKTPLKLSIMELSTYNWNRVSGDLSNNERTLHHEIFHNVKPSKEFLESFNSINEHCSLISNYACSSQNEELSEAWAESFDKLNLEKYKLIHNVYGETLLK